MELLLALDYGLMYFAGAQQRPWLTPAVIALTQLGNPWVLCVVVVVGSVALFVAKRRAEAIALIVGGLVCLSLDSSFKTLIARERPDVVWRAIELPASPSYPSGHALGAFAVYGLLGWFLTTRPSLRFRGWGFVLGVAVGLSRVYLGVHYPMDVVGGWLGGLFAVWCALGVRERVASAGTAPLLDSTAPVVPPAPPAT